MNLIFDINKCEVFIMSDKKGLSFAQLRRDALSGHMALELVERYGKKPEQSVICPVCKVETKSIYILRDGKESWIHMPYASLVYYDGRVLEVYAAGLRDLTPVEKKVMDGWKEITSTESYKSAAMSDVYSDGSSTYYKQERYFRDSPCPYLFYDDGSKKLDMKTGKVRDSKIKGMLELKYIVHKI